MSGSPSYASRWAVQDGTTAFSGTSLRINPKTDTVGSNEPLLVGRGIRGVRARQYEDTRVGPRTVGGDLTFDATPYWVNYFLARAIGGTTLAPVMADPVPEWQLLQDRTGDVYKFGGLKINRYTLSSQSNGLLELAISVVGKTCTEGQAWAAGATIGSSSADENRPIQHADLVLTMFGITVPVEQLTFTVDNKLAAKHRNSLTPQHVLEGMREVKLSGTAVFTATEAAALYGNGDTPGTGASLVLNGVNNEDTTLSFSRLMLPSVTPQLQGDEILLPFTAEVLGTGGAAEFTVSNSIGA